MYDHLSEESKVKLIEYQWKDHFQTRIQTWKSLEIVAILSVAIIGLDWNIDNIYSTVVAVLLLLGISSLGTQITLKHRKVEINKFSIMQDLGLSLNVTDEKQGIPEPLTWWSIFKIFSKSNTSLFILRMHFVIQAFAILYLGFRLWDHRFNK